MLYGSLAKLLRWHGTDLAVRLGLCNEDPETFDVGQITAAQLALQSQPDFAKVSLDVVIRTMWETAGDMSQKYKETADGGLALHIPLSLPEC